LKVLYLSEGFTPHDKRFVSAILESNVELYYSAMKEFTLIPDSFWKNDKISRLEISKDLNLLEGKINEHGIDLIHINPINEFTLKLMSRKLRPQVVMSWGSDILIKSKYISNELLSHGLSKADGFFTDCHVVTQNIKKYLTSEIAFEEFPWGIEPEQYLMNTNIKEGKKIRTSLRWQKSNVIISTRSWESHYNIERLLEAFQILQSKRGNYKLILASSGSLKSKIMGIIKKNKLENDIYCPGLIDQNLLARWYYAADFYISTSKSDGSSISMLEAMMCKLPCICHNEYGNLEWISNHKNGWLVDCNNTESILSGMLEADRKKNDWDRIGHLNRIVVQDKALWNENKSKIFKMYRYILMLNTDSSISQESIKVERSYNELK
jgi:L-malate glycosyltransferase